MHNSERSTLTRRAALGLMAAAPVFGATFAGAVTVPEAFPKRPLSLVVPFSPGGPVDILGRLLAELPGALGQSGDRR